MSLVNHGNSVRDWLLVGLLIGLWVCPAPAQQPPTSPAPGAAVRAAVTGTTVDLSEPRMIQISADLEIDGPPGRWYSVYYQFRLDANTPLKRQDRTDLMEQWGNLYSPAMAGLIRWSGMTVKIPWSQLELSSNLPAGRRSVVWVICDVWDVAASRYVVSGWGARTALIVTTDRQGKIVNLEPFHVDPIVLSANGRQRVQARPMQLAVGQLQPRAGARIYRVNGALDVLLDDQGQCLMTSTSRGYFFETVDTSAKAVELALLAYPNAVVIKHVDQYKKIVEAVRPVGWQYDQQIKRGMPASYDITVIEQPGLGYQVSLLTIDNVGRPDEPLFGPVVHRQINIGLDGRMGIRQTLWIHGPEQAFGRMPGADRFAARYRQAVRMALMPAGAELIRDCLNAGATEALIPVAQQ